MRMEIPAHVAFIIDRLESAGFEAYAVGGCVRDTILGRKPEDWDITTSARPEQVKRLFRRTADTGIKHGPFFRPAWLCGRGKDGGGRPGNGAQAFPDQ